jgi:hypothetical protein
MEKMEKMETLEKLEEFVIYLNNQIYECENFESIDSKIKDIAQKKNYQINGFFKGIENNFFSVVIDGVKREIFIKVFTSIGTTSVFPRFQASLTLNEKINKKGHLLILRPLKYERMFPLAMFVENMVISTGSDMHIVQLPRVVMESMDGWNAAAFSAALGVKSPYFSGFRLSMRRGL